MRVLRYAGPTAYTGPEGETIKLEPKDEGWIWRVTSADGQWMADLTKLDFVRTMLRVDLTELDPREVSELAQD